MRDVRFGRIRIPTTFDDIAEAVGDQIEAVGGGVVAGERQARSFRLSFPIRGTFDDVDPYEAGVTLRRQVRSLMENGRARLEGVYAVFAFDPELNGWMIVGSGDLTYTDGGISMSEFKLTLGDAFRVANKRTHREARRLDYSDRRLSTVPRDYLGQLYSTDFAAMAASIITPIPVGAMDVVGQGGRYVSGSIDAGSIPYRNSLAGRIYLLAASVNGEVMHFERAEDSIHLFDDVVIHDQRDKGDQTQGHAAAILPLSPIVYYRMSDADGATVATDTSGNGLAGAYQGTPFFQIAGATADDNKGTGFSGPDGAYMRTNDDVRLDITGNLTAMGWLKPYGFTETCAIISKDSGSSGSYGYRFGWDSAQDKLLFEFSANGTTRATATSVVAGLTVNVWTHLAVTYTASTGTVVFYKNGQQLGAPVTGLATSIFANTRRLTIGKWNADA